MKKQKTTLRFSKEDKECLADLEAKLCLCKSEIVRIAIRYLSRAIESNPEIAKLHGRID